jgi:prepilin-type N-terminal cleavage/methylation domain-containing protein
MNSRRSKLKPAFTLLELLVAIGILVTLAAILVPVVSTVRDRARGADTQAFITQLEGAINRYQTDFRAFPGPFSDNQLTNVGGISGLSLTPATGFDTAVAFATGNAPNSVDRITSSENLVLGLLGGLRPATSGPNPLTYNPADVGLGPASLNPGRPSRSSAYVDAVNLSWNGPTTALTGSFSDEAGTGATAPTDTIIPEFVDRYSSPLPVIYVRSRVGTAPGVDNIISETALNTAYNLNHFSAYTQSSIGVGRTPATTGLDTGRVHGLTSIGTGGFIGTQANQGLPYFTAAGTSGTTALPRNKDRFVLISAGRDRVYGTGDDITNFGRF